MLLKKSIILGLLNKFLLLMKSFLMTSQIHLEVLRRAGKTLMGIFFFNYTGSSHVGQSICNLREIANRKTLNRKIFQVRGGRVTVFGLRFR